MLNFYLYFLPVTLVIMYLLYLYGEKIKKADFADLAWVVLVWIQAPITALLNNSLNTAANIFLNIAITLWAFKLGAYLYKRVALSKIEDSRYAYYRDTWGASAKWKMPAIFLLQPIYAVFFAWPVVLGNYAGASFSYAGILLWLVGIVGTYIADRQLAKFKRTASHGSVCKEGLWRYSRHPNYFFEWITWCSLPLFFLHNTGMFFATLVTPAVVYWLLNYFSGIPPLELTAIKTKGQAYLDYIKETNKFFPGAVR